MQDELKVEINKFFEENSYNRILSNNSANIQFLKYYETVYKEDVCGACPGKFAKAYNQLKYFTTSNKSLIMKEESVFELQKDIVIYDKISHSHYSSKNLTDQGALNLLASNPKFAKKFTKLPDGWEQMVEDHKAGIIKEASIESPRPLTPKEQGPTNEELKEDLFSSTKKNLQGRCKEMGLPFENWSGFTRDGLAEYLYDQLVKPSAD